MRYMCLEFKGEVKVSVPPLSSDTFTDAFIQKIHILLGEHICVPNFSIYTWTIAVKKKKKKEIPPLLERVLSVA